jgi:hypothetical protein
VGRSRVANNCLGTDRNISFFRLHQIRLAKITVKNVTCPLLTPFGTVQRGQNENIDHHAIDVFVLDYTSDVNNETIKLKVNSVALVRKRTILTERPPLVGEVSAKFSG